MFYFSDYYSAIIRIADLFLQVLFKEGQDQIESFFDVSINVFLV